MDAITKRMQEQVSQWLHDKSQRDNDIKAEREKRYSDFLFEQAKKRKEENILRRERVAFFKGAHHVAKNNHNFTA